MAKNDITDRSRQRFPQGIKKIFISLALPLIVGLSVASAAASPDRHATIRPTYLAKAMQNLQRSNQRWIEIDLSRQRLIAWEGAVPTYAILISTGKGSTPTPIGVYSIQSRYRYARMQGEDYDISDVPYTLYFAGSYAIHGAYWHHNFGTPISHGCVNVAVNHARWLFHWASIGTPVAIHR